MNFIRKFVSIAIIICSILSGAELTSLAAEGDDTRNLCNWVVNRGINNENYRLGGSYQDVLTTLSDYYEDTNVAVYDDCGVYKLIPDEVLNIFIAHVRQLGNDNESIDFLSDGSWVPSIIMNNYDINMLNFYFSAEGRQNDILSHANRLKKYGNIKGVITEELNFIALRFNGKYEEAIDQARTYLDNLIEYRSNMYIQMREAEDRVYRIQYSDPDYSLTPTKASTDDDLHYLEERNYCSAFAHRPDFDRDMPIEYNGVDYEQNHYIFPPSFNECDLPGNSADNDACEAVCICLREPVDDEFDNLNSCAICE